jgi:hypothetical protein
MNELIQERLNNYFKTDIINPFNLVMISIINIPDSFVNELYQPVLNEPNKFLLADIFSMLYLSIRNIYDLPCLNNVKYREKKPTAISVYGESISILGSVSLIIESTNELLKIMTNHFPNLIEMLPEILISLNKMIINPFEKNNMETIKKNLMNEYKSILNKLS